MLFDRNFPPNCLLFYLFLPFNKGVSISIWGDRHRIVKHLMTSNSMIR